ncbi:MAG: 4a-hydroxytetrahydrobiopterin dehydratase [Candidatus Marinimicrobia bacterium]|nr:4a-hydroxytetrahydrobiopterin dehydratase [Candidatus Neomarinimicrobiota bacterium]|tara:strand:- start:5109 stop:5402 length:294 start_codon:yes stop_codon:yes gene_type:complete
MSENCQLLSQTEIDKFLKSHNEWKLSNNGIERELKFDTYLKSIDFINKIAIKAEELNHHPDMKIGYCNIKICFYTHDLNGLSNYDLKMVEATNNILG